MIATINQLFIKSVIVILMACIVISCCHPNSLLLEPTICYFPTQRVVEQLTLPFPELSPEELSQDWGKELFLGSSFAKDMDFYRAITCFKRASLLLPNEKSERSHQIEYNIVLSYYIAGRHQEAIEAFETSDLINIPQEFPILEDLLVILYDSYMQIGRTEKACRMLAFLSTLDYLKATNLSLENAIQEGDIESITRIAQSHAAEEAVTQFLCQYATNAKSVRKAQVLNAILPGAGFYYVGQTKSALTSFILNTLFIIAAYQFFDRGYIAAGLITTSFECGWYFGGINGAGLAVKEYNQQLYSVLGKELMFQHRLFPILMLQKGF